MRRPEKERETTSKQCEFCNYDRDKSLISQGCQSGSIAQGGPGGWSRWLVQGGPDGSCGPYGPGDPSGQGGPGGEVVMC